MIHIYTEEDMETDIEWLKGYGIDEKEARNFVTRLLRL